jgi:6-phospho-3-hexuloisomerase
MAVTRFAAASRQACEEVAAVLDRVDQAQVEALVEAIAAARRIALHGVGREGLMMRAFTMRLFHMGLDAHPVADITTPPVGKGDLLIASDGPGHLATVRAYIDVGRAAGARTALITAQPASDIARRVDLVLCLPAQTMANDTGAAASVILPMGSAYEGAQFLAFEILVLMLRERLQISPEAMRARHTNLE